MKILGFIPARSGSKGVKNKNVRLVKGIPLLEYSTYTAAKAKKAGFIDEILVSTDSSKYLSLIKNYDICNDYLRPKELAQDSSPTIDCVKHAIEWYKEKKNKTFDAVIILQPTSPFRTIDHIKKSILLMENSIEATCITSIVKLTDHHPLRIMKVTNNNKLENFCCEHIEPEPSRRQDFYPEAFIRNGAIYLTKINTIMNNNCIRGNWVLGMEMPEANSINIDDNIDLLTANAAIDYKDYRSDLKFFDELIQRH